MILFQGQVELKQLSKSMSRRIKIAAFESIQGRIFYGWVILVVVMLGMLGTGLGQSHLIGIFFDSLATDLELPRTSGAAAYGIATLVAAFLLPQVGKLVDRFGAAGLMWILVLCLGLAAVMFSCLLYTSPSPRDA